MLLTLISVSHFIFQLSHKTQDSGAFYSDSLRSSVRSSTFESEGTTGYIPETTYPDPSVGNHPILNGNIQETKKDKRHRFVSQEKRPLSQEKVSRPQEKVSRPQEKTVVSKRAMSRRTSSSSESDTEYNLKELSQISRKKDPRQSALNSSQRALQEAHRSSRESSSPRDSPRDRIDSPNRQHPLSGGRASPLDHSRPRSPMVTQRPEHRHSPRSHEGRNSPGTPTHSVSTPTQRHPHKNREHRNSPRHHAPRGIMDSGELFS